MEGAQRVSAPRAGTAAGLPSYGGTTTTTSDAALSARNVSITRKVNKLLDVDSNEQFRQVLQHTEEVCPALLTVEGQARLKGGARLQNAVSQPLHAHVLALHDEFLAQLKEIRDVYRLVASDVRELETVVTDLHSVVSDAAAKAEPLVTAVTVYREELKEIKAREEQVQELMSRYNISNDETEVLQSGSIDDNFLKILLRVRSIHQSCRELLIAEHQQAVIEIMEKMYLLQVHATERLALWLCTHCGEVLTADTPVLSDFFIKCVGVTYERPAQFMRVINEVGRARKATVIRRFYDLLSRGGDGHQPLDACSNDPVRYVSTMLSWVHQSIAEEEDLLRCFFPKSSGVAATTTATTTSSAARSQHEEGAEEPMSPHSTGSDSLLGPSSTSAAISIKDVLEQIFESISKHFRTRFDQVTDRCVRTAGVSAVATAMGGGGGDAFHTGVPTVTSGSSHGSSVGGSAAATGGIASGNTANVMLIFFQLEGILGFYSETVSQLLLPNASLAVTISQAKLDAMRVFYNFLQLGTSQMLASVGGGSGGGGGSAGPAFLPRDLASTREVDAMLHLLKSMLNSMSEGLVPHSQREAEMAPILGAIVDPLVSIATAAGQATASLTFQLGAQRNSISPPPSNNNNKSNSTINHAEDDSTIARLVFSVNIVSRIQQMLSGYPFTTTRANKLAQTLEEEQRALTSRCVERALFRTGLGGKSEMLQSRRDPNGPLFGAPLTPEDISSIETAVRQLYTYVYSVGALPTTSVEKLQNVRTREDILKSVTSSVCESYERLHALVHASASPSAVQSPLGEVPLAGGSTQFYPLTTGGYCDDALRALLAHSPKHIRVLLDVDTIAAGVSVV